jgi:hypothetical protein
MGLGQPHDCRHLVGGAREDNAIGGAPDQRGIFRVEIELDGFVEHPVLPEERPKLVDECHDLGE